MKHFSVAEARANFAKLIDQSTGGEKPVVITRNGEPKAILLDYAEYVSMVEIIEIMSDAKAYAALQEDKANPNADHVSLEEVRQQLTERAK